MQQVYDAIARNAKNLIPYAKAKQLMSDFMKRYTPKTAGGAHIGWIREVRDMLLAAGADSKTRKITMLMILHDLRVQTCSALRKRDHMKDASTQTDITVDVQITSMVDVQLKRKRDTVVDGIEALLSLNSNGKKWVRCKILSEGVTEKCTAPYHLLPSHLTDM